MRKPALCIKLDEMKKEQNKANEEPKKEFQIDESSPDKLTSLEE